MKSVAKDLHALNRASVIWIAVWLAAGVLFGGLAFLPASLSNESMTRLLQNATRSQASTWQAQGTIWQGTGQMVLADKGNATRKIPIAWQFQPASLFRLKAEWKVAATGRELSGAAFVGRSFSDYQLRDAAFSADASLLSLALPTLALVQPSGRLALKMDANEPFVIGASQPHEMRGKFRANIEQLRLATVADAPLASGAMSVDAAGMVMTMTVTESSGQLAIAGGGTMAIAPPGAWRFEGTVTPSSTADAALTQKMRSLGTPDSSGKIPFRFQGTW